MAKRALALLLAIPSAFYSLFGIAKDSPKQDEAVIVHFIYGSDDLDPIFELENKLEETISKGKLGVFDGDDFAADGSDGNLYMYGPSADRLFEAIRPILESSKFMQGARIKKRYGPPQDGVKEVEIVLDGN